MMHEKAYINLADSRSKQVVLEEVEGFRGTLIARCSQLTANIERDYLNIEQTRSLAAESAKVNQLVPCNKLCDC